MARPRGEQITQARLTDAKVRTIRIAAVNGATLSELARRYGVHVSTIFHVVHRNTWRHVV